MMKLGVLIAVLAWGMTANAEEQPCNLEHIAKGAVEKSVVGVSGHCSPKKIEKRVEHSVKEKLPGHDAAEKTKHLKAPKSLKQVEKEAVKKALED